MPSTSITITKHADHLRRRYRSTVRQAERARESIKALSAEEAVAKQRADEAGEALKTACKEAGISRYWSATDSGHLPEYTESEKADVAYNAACIELDDARLTYEALAISATVTATAYVAEIISSNQGRLEGIKLHYKKARDFLTEVASTMDGLRLYGSGRSVDVSIDLSQRIGMSRCVTLIPYSIHGDEVVHFDRCPQLPTDEGATLAEIKRAVKTYHGARSKVMAMRDAYQAQVYAITAKLGPLPSRVIEDIEKSARTYF